MRNVTIWAGYNTTEQFSRTVSVRVFEYKGYKGTLNEFLFPNYVLRDGHLCPRDRDAHGYCIPFNPAVKGSVVVMAYNDTDAMTRGDGKPLIVFNNFEQAVHWLVGNNYYFRGDESATRRTVKLKSIDLSARQAEYDSIASSYDTSLVSNVTEGNGCQPESEAKIDLSRYQVKQVAHQSVPNRNVVDNTVLNGALTKLNPPSGQDPELPDILKYPPVIHRPSLWSRWKKFFGF